MDIWQNGKYKVENYKTKRRVKVPDSEHIIVKNTHEAIISEETFETVQTVLSARHLQHITNMKLI